MPFCTAAFLRKSRVDNPVAWQHSISDTGWTLASSTKSLGLGCKWRWGSLASLREGRRGLLVSCYSQINAYTSCKDLFWRGKGGTCDDKKEVYEHANVQTCFFENLDKPKEKWKKRYLYEINNSARGNALLADSPTGDKWDRKPGGFSMKALTEEGALVSLWRAPSKFTRWLQLAPCQSDYSHSPPISTFKDLYHPSLPTACQLIPSACSEVSGNFHCSLIVSRWLKITKVLKNKEEKSTSRQKWSKLCCSKN